MKTLLSNLVCLIILALHGQSFAAVHTWISSPAPVAAATSGGTPSPMVQQAAGNPTLPPVTITGSTIQWGYGSFDIPFSEMPSYVTVGGGLSGGIQQQRSRAIDLSSVCTNPAISADAKATTSTTGPTNRWLAAQEMFNTLLAQKMLTFYYQSLNISVIIDGKAYQAFRVTYADGAKESWIVNPGYATSSIKLFDSPAPDSLTAPSPALGCAV